MAVLDRGCRTDLEGEMAAVGVFHGCINGYWTASWKRGNYPGFADGFVEGLKPHG